MTERFEKFTKEVATAGKCISKIKAHEMKQFDLRGGCVMCLFFIGQSKDGLTATEICELCGEDKAGVSRTLSTLRERGYIDASDYGVKYRARFRVTDSGREVCDSVRNAICRAVTSAGGNLSDEERDIFYRVFEKINSRLLSICASLD
ncbi:MAG: winged helix-turn-helix transcriptional regulator [Oscillospiraceae bacterium]|nr:winged helix-turn-helix transcriptional regulator [Oscillospiraceae bacterium]